MATPEARVGRRHLLAGVAALGALPALGGGLAGCSATAAETRVSFLNWQDYIAPGLLDGYEESSGLTVGYETYESNDQLEERLAAAAVTRKGGRRTTSFDLVVPSSNLFSRLRDGNALQPLDRAVVTPALLANLDPALRELTPDAESTYSVPWATGTTGIGYDRTVFPEPPDWSVFLETEHSGRMSLLDEVREAFAAALFSLGEDPNTTDPAVIGAAEQRLEELTAVSRLNSATYLKDLAEGRLVAAQGFSTDVLQAARTNPDIAFVLPASGATVWVDLLCVPVDAPNPDGANELIAYYLDPKVSATNAEFNRVSTGNLAARGLLPAEVRDDPAIFPPADIASSLAGLKNLGEAEKLYAAAWDRVTAG